MLISLAILWGGGLFLAGLMDRLHLPRLVGMVLAGILTGPYLLDWLDVSLLDISGHIRQLALVIILTRAGLRLQLGTLKEVGRPALLLSFLPALLEMGALTLLAPLFFPLSFLEAAILASVLAAVSPAIIVPRMIRLMDQGFGSRKGIPQMIMAAASVDDIFVIMVFGLLTQASLGGPAGLGLFLALPSSVLLGLAGGILAGGLLIFLFDRVHLQGTEQVVLVLSLSFLLLFIQEQAKGTVAFSGLLAVMALGAFLAKERPRLALSLAASYEALWTGAEILLFSLIGASLDLSYAGQASGWAFLLIILGLLVRLVGVSLSLVGTSLNGRERLYTGFSYLPKATVQAAIGGLPLAMGLACGQTVLTLAVLSILLTAPLGAFLMDRSYRRLLSLDGPRQKSGSLFFRAGQYKS